MMNDAMVVKDQMSALSQDSSVRPFLEFLRSSPAGHAGSIISIHSAALNIETMARLRKLFPKIK